VIRLRLGASGAEKLCALGTMIGRFCAALNFTVRPRETRCAGARARRPRLTLYGAAVY
jgi:hypothetical protein